MIFFFHVGSLVEAFYTTPEFCLVAVNMPDQPKSKGKSSRKGDKSHSQRANVVAFVLGSIIVHSRCGLRGGPMWWRLFSAASLCTQGVVCGLMNSRCLTSLYHYWVPEIPKSVQNARTFCIENQNGNAARYYHVRYFITFLYGNGNVATV
jgi:hypothetical protein